MQILLSRSPAGPGRTGKQEQEQISPTHVQAFFPSSVLGGGAPAPPAYFLPFIASSRGLDKSDVDGRTRTGAVLGGELGIPHIERPQIFIS